METLFGLLFQLTTLFSGGIKGTQDWNINANWIKTADYYVFTASSKKILNECSDERLNLQLPQVVHGVHELLVDGKLVFSSGDNTFQKSTPFYFHPKVSCKLLKGNTLEWRVTTYSKFFTRFRYMPYATNIPAESKFFDIQLNLLCFSSLVFIVLFSLVCFFGKVAKLRLLATTFGGACLSIYSLMTVNNEVSIDLTMLIAHKLADIALSAGMIAYIFSFYLSGLIGKKLFVLNLITFSFCAIIIFFGINGDIVQLGTTLQMPITFISLLTIAKNLAVKSYKSQFSASSLLESISIYAFIICGTNDMLHIFGIINSYMIMPVGATLGVFLLAASVNQDIEKTYQERDDLVNNLQSKVDEQTRHLTTALDQVQKSQADLVQSARLASLGTLSAGIAHEINNAINYVNGAVIPLERKVMKSIPEADRVITQKLFAAIKEGTHLTVEIVRSLRNFTGLNQAKVKDVSLLETLTSVLTILKSKLSHIVIHTDISDKLVLNCYQVGLNQIFMNLISNAIDVLPAANGKISIAAKEIDGDIVEIRMTDNGHGMTNEIKERIFDPFFTTKEVGKGTGLGLHIVKKEIERHFGNIKVQSEINVGTTFIIQIPKNIEASKISEAA